MQTYDYLIIGGGVSGVTAAEEIRGHDAGASVAIVSEESEPLYSRVLLPHYAKGRIKREQVFLRKLDDYAPRGIELLRGMRATALDPNARTITLASGEMLGFGKCILASGGIPRPLGIPGEELPGISRFQTLDDTDRMMQLLADATSGVVLGASFIALEYLEILTMRNIPTTLLFRGPYFFSGHIDEKGGEFFAANFRRHHITVFPGTGVREFLGEGRLREVMTTRDERIPANFFGAGIGVSKDQSWLRGAGIPASDAGVRVNECLETGVPGIFAAGDAAEIFDPATGRARSYGNWAQAVLSGSIAGANAVGKERMRCDIFTSYSIQNLGLIIAFLGDMHLDDRTHAFSRTDPNGGWYECFAVREGRIVGVALVNRGSDRTAASRLIREGASIPNPKVLTDPAFDIASLQAK